MTSNPYASHNDEVKANFDHVYDLPDPRGYFEALGSLDYRAPEHGRRLFPTLVRAAADGTTPRVLDLCCSYGVNAALLNHDLTLDDLYTRYASPDLAALPTEDLLASDRAFYAGNRRRFPLSVTGADVAANAVSYAVRAGLLEAGFGENLEEAHPSGPFVQSVAGAGLVTVTGGIGYIWVRTFEGVLRAIGEDPHGRPPWIATLPSRVVDYGPLADLFSRHGLVTERLASRTFPQRRFADAAEREHVLRKLSEVGVDPSGKEEEGYYHADLYLSRPPEQAADTPIDRLFDATGALDY